MPKMPELKGKSFPTFYREPIDTDTIRFKDKNREKHRQKKLAEQKAKPEAPRRSFIKNKSWSKQTNKKEKKKKNAAKRKRNEVKTPCYSLKFEPVMCVFI